MRNLHRAKAMQCELPHATDEKLKRRDASEAWSCSNPLPCRAQSVVEKQLHQLLSNIADHHANMFEIC